LATIPNPLTENVITKDSTVLKFFQEAGGKCLELLISFISEPYEHGISNEFLYRHESAGEISHREYLDVPQIRNFSQFVIPNTEEMQKLREVLSAFESFNFRNTILLSEKELALKRYYYLRAMYSVLFLTKLENHELIKKSNPDLVQDVMAALLSGLSSEFIPMHIEMLLDLFTFYRMKEPVEFYRAMVQMNLVYALLMNVDHSRCRDFIISIIGCDDK
jgi:hypothetical protein